jgi:hypothetical protein
MAGRETNTYCRRIDVGIVAVAMAFALAAHLIEIALWALLFMICGYPTMCDSRHASGQLDDPTGAEHRHLERAAR